VDAGMVRYRIEVGRNHGVMPRDIVGAIANEAGVEYAYIGYIGLEEDYSTVDLPEGMPKEIFQHLKKIRVRQRPLNISVVAGKAASTTGESGNPGGQEAGFASLKRNKPAARPVKPGVESKKSGSAKFRRRKSARDKK
jgi:ATP-dependent RNA helicase DeaD